MTPLVVGIVVVALCVIVVALLVRRRRANDTVDSFRRGLDALSPEARRPVVDQVQHHSEPDEPTVGADDDDEEDDARGT